MPAALRPWLWVAPTATAAAFFATPASSTPTGSSETSHTTPERWNTSATRWASGSECEAHTSPAPDSTISRACAGPPTHAMRSAPNARSSATVGGVPSGGTRPLASETTPARVGHAQLADLLERLPHPLRGHGEEHEVGALELVAAGAERPHLEALRERDPGQVVRVLARGRPARSACSAVRQSSVVRTPARSSRSATAVPNEPAPTTLARRGCWPG